MNLTPEEKAKVEAYFHANEAELLVRLTAKAKAMWEASVAAVSKLEGRTVTAQEALTDWNDNGGVQHVSDGNGNSEDILFWKSTPIIRVLSKLEIVNGKPGNEAWKIIELV